MWPRLAANRVRISAQLIDASNGAHIWADRFDGDVEDVFDLQDRVTESVAGALEPRIRFAEIERSRRKPTENLLAYYYFLRALAEFHKTTKEPNREAVRLLERAIELDPDYSTAYGLAAYCYAYRKGNGWMVTSVLGPESVQVVDPGTVRIKLVKPFVAFLQVGRRAQDP